MSTSCLETTPNQIEAINKELNTTEKEVDEITNLLKEWIQQQPHLPKEKGELFDRRIKCMLRCNKMSLEKTKQKLDMFYTVKNIFPVYFMDNEPLQPRMQRTMETFIFLPLPKPMDDFTRVHIYRLHDTDVEKFIMDDSVALTCITLGLRSCYDVCISEIFIFDLQNYSLPHILRHNPATFKQLNDIFEKAYANRVVGVHYLNMPSYAEAIVNFIKRIMKKKIGDRIHIHPNLESLHQKVPKRILPADYGGEEKPLLELRNNWNKFLEDNNSIISEQLTYTSNEKLRPGKAVTSELFGIEGSFRKLDID